MLVISDRRSAAMVGRDKEAVDVIFHSFKDELFICIIAHKSFSRQINLT